MAYIKRKGDKEIGFIDPSIIFSNPKTIPRDEWITQTQRNLRRFLVNQKTKQYILFPYNFR